jgi:hypothetical protein
MAKNGSAVYDDPFNEVKGKDPNKPDTDGMDLYFGGYDAVISIHGTMGPDSMMGGSNNAQASRDVYGSVVKGEPDALKKGSVGGR